MRATADFSAQACGKGNWADTGVLTGEFSAHRINKARSERKTLSHLLVTTCCPQQLTLDQHSLSVAKPELSQHQQLRGPDGMDTVHRC